VQNHAIDPFGIVGQVLDAQFRVDRIVGEGGFSAVYRGHHLGLDEPIAIKCLKLPPSLSSPLVEQFAKRFRDESRILYRLSQGNLNIVRSIAAGTWQTNTGVVVPYMILEWMEGRSLANEFTIRRTVGQQGRPLAEVVKVFGPAADGLGYAHSQGVVHRDLNPGNLFLAASPQGTRMKVLDFGVAKILDDSTIDIARTQTVGHIRIFAPAYGAPEQFDEAIGKVGAATDVYSFALILLEALRDRCVNDGQHLGEFAQRAVDPNRRPTPRMLGIDVPDEVEQIFARATKLDPRERWQSAGELWQALAIASSAASQQKHAQAAKETPPLAMPQVSRSTKSGIAPPPQPQKTQGTARMDRTMPIGSVLPNLAAPSPNEGEVPSLEDEDIPTRVGVRPGQVAAPQTEDEVTRVRAEAEMLHGLAALEARGRGATMTTSAAQSKPTPAAGMPPDTSEPVPPSGTLITSAAFGPTGPTYPMQPPAQAQHPESLRSSAGQHLAQTLPLVGPHPLGIASHTASSGGPLPSAGAPPSQHLQPQHQQAQPPPSQQHPQHPYPHPPHPHAQQQQHPMLQQHIAMPAAQYGQPPHGQRMAESVSMATVVPGVPKKNNTVLFIALGFGALAVIGIVLTIIVVLGGKGDGKGPVASGSSSSSTPIASAPPPPPPSPPPPEREPAPLAVVAADAGDKAENSELFDAGSAAATPTTTATATATTPAPTPTTPDVVPTPPPPAVKDAGPPPDPNAFSETGARSRLGQANGVLAFCKKEGGVTGPGTAMITFATDGTVSAVKMEPPYAGTPAGDCVTGHFKRTKVNPFQGSPQTLKHTFEVPK
jgi:serine/threonine protein kinase